jgi:hypothetical protein
VARDLGLGDALRADDHEPLLQPVVDEAAAALIERAGLDDGAQVALEAEVARHPGRRGMRFAGRGQRARGAARGRRVATLRHRPQDTAVSGQPEHGIDQMRALVEQVAEADRADQL